MKLKSLQAENFMRFEEVDLSGIPDEGLFCVRGMNESGKSTLGFLLAYALSGRTTTGAEAFGLINWSKGGAKISLKFENASQVYEINRHIDRDGSNFSSLSLEGEILAQGNDEVNEKLNEVLGYNPHESHRVFMMTHRTIQEYSASSPREKIEEMLGLRRIRDLISFSEKESQMLMEQMDQNHTTVNRLQSDVDGVGYEEEEEISQNKKSSELSLKCEEQQKIIDDIREKLSHLSISEQSVAEEEKQIKLLVEKDDFEEVSHFIKGSLDRLSQLRIHEKIDDKIKETTHLMQGFPDYQQSLNKLSQRFEDKLNEMREKLGLNKDASKDSFLVSEKNFKKKISRNRFLTRISFAMAGTFMLLIASLVAFYIYRVPAQDWIRSQGLIMEFHQGQLKQGWDWLQKEFSDGGQGYPAGHGAWAIMSFSVLLELLLIALFFRKIASGKKAKKDQVELMESKEGLQSEYRELLAADFKDFPEVAQIIQKSKQKSLEDALDELNRDNPFFAKNEYKIPSCVGILRGQIEEIHQSTNLKIHEIKLSLQQAEESMAEVQNHVSDLAPVLDKISTKKENYHSLKTELEDFQKKQSLLKKDLACRKNLGQLSSSCLESIEGRLQLIMTSLFKKILPTVTGVRYASIKLDKDFNILVFSEERGDFVPLSQLSSGTHDLIVLALQFILVCGFMESKNISEHFIFLDEPFMAVDDERYQKFTDMLLHFSPRLKQIFLCRPPEGNSSKYQIKTNLDSRVLKANLSTMV